MNLPHCHQSLGYFGDGGGGGGARLVGGAIGAAELVESVVEEDNDG